MFKYIVAGTMALASLTGYSATRTVAGQVTFQAVGKPSFMKINGEGGQVVGTAEEDAAGVVTGTFTVQTGTLTTGMALRDKHMRDKYLGTGEAKLVLKPWTKTAAASPFAGDLTIKGQTKAVTGTASVSSDGKLHAEFALNVEDYPAIGVPSFEGITVAGKVTVTVDAEVK